MTGVPVHPRRERTAAITGTTKLRPDQEWIVAEAVLPLPAGTVIIVGGAAGVDVAAARVAMAAREPDGSRRFHVHGVFPSAAFAREARDLCDSHEFVPPGRTAGESYLRRDRRMVTLADRLLAFPPTATEARRSGTWATVRYARETHTCSVAICPLDRPRPPQPARQPCDVAADAAGPAETWTPATAAAQLVCRTHDITLVRQPYMSDQVWGHMTASFLAVHR